MHGVQQQTGEFDELCSFMHNIYSGWYGSLNSFWQPVQSHPSTFWHRQRHAQDARLWLIAARLEIQKYYSWLKYLRPIFIVLCPPTPIIWYTSEYQHRLAKRKIGADTGPTATLLWWLSWKGGEGGWWLLERCLYFLSLIQVWSHSPVHPTILHLLIWLAPLGHFACSAQKNWFLQGFYLVSFQMNEY